MQYLHLDEAQANSIIQGEQKAIVRSARLDGSELIALVSGEVVLGELEIGPVRKIDYQTFLRYESEHLVSEQDWADRWPGRRTFWLYPIQSFDVYDEPKDIEEKEGEGPGRGWWGPPRGTHGAVTDTELEYRGRLTEGDVRERTGLSPVDYSEMFQVSDYTTKIAFVDGPGTMVTARVVWYGEEGQSVGFAFRQLDGKACNNDTFKIHDKGKGLGRQLYKQQIDVLTKAGYEEIRLFANITIGRYAWAKMGFDYAPVGKLSSTDLARAASGKFQGWATKRDVAEPTGGWPKFKSVRDVAVYTVSGVSLKGADITNRDVSSDMSLSLGKAFMLDAAGDGHGSWGGVLKLGKD